MAEAKKTAKSKIKTADSKEKQIRHAEVVAETVPADNVPEIKIETEKITAKAGKRSAKSAKEAEEKQAKEVRKTETPADNSKETKAVKPARPKEERAGKKYRQAFKLIDKTKEYTLEEALDLAVKSSVTKFDSSVEMHINLGVDPKQADQNVRDTVALPAGTGKKIKIAVLAEIEDDAKAKAAGADIVGAEAIVAKLDKEELDFDVLITLPSMMPRLGKYARLLGPRGLMPNPKSGTVTQNVEAAVKEAKAGKVEYRVDQSGIIHLSIGKVSFGKDKLLQNAQAVLVSVRAAKPASLKGNYIKSIYVTSTMGPSVKVDVSA